MKDVEECTILRKKLPRIISKNIINSSQQCNVGWRKPFEEEKFVGQIDSAHLLPISRPTCRPTLCV